MSDKQYWALKVGVLPLGSISGMYGTSILPASLYVIERRIPVFQMSEYMNELNSFEKK